MPRYTIKWKIYNISPLFGLKIKSMDYYVLLKDDLRCFMLEFFWFLIFILFLVVTKIYWYKKLNFFNFLNISLIKLLHNIQRKLLDCPDDVTWRHVTSCDVIWRHITRHMTSYDVTWRHVTSYDVPRRVYDG